MIPLTARELDLLECLANGMTARKAAKKLFVAESTISNHSKSMRDHLGAKTLAQSIAIASRLGLLIPDGDGFIVQRGGAR